MTKPFIVSETELVNMMKTFIDDCDADELARIAGEIFGGQCLWNGFDENVFDREEYYSFEPDENYWGAFDTGYEEE
jgi:hypothetical protein